MSEQDLAIANRDVPPQSDAAGSLAGRISQTIEGIVAFHEREQLKIGNSRRRLATVSGLVSRPLLITVLSFVVPWVSGNALAGRLGMTPFDPAPFPRLQGLLTPAALLTTTVVLIAQNREARLESQRSHLGLQVNLLTEQKVTKLIRLLEELRRDLPMVKDRHDPEAVSLQRHADAAQVLAALEHVGVGSGGRKADAVKP